MAQIEPTKGKWIIEGSTLGGEPFLHPGAIIIRAPEASHWVAYVLPFNNSQKDDEQIANARVMAAAKKLLRELENAEKLIAALNYAFYVKGTSKALQPVMGETKAALMEIRSVIYEAKGE